MTLEDDTTGNELRVTGTHDVSEFLANADALGLAESTDFIHEGAVQIINIGARSIHIASGAKLTHNPDTHVIVSDASGMNNPVIEIDGGTYEYGLETTRNGNTRYSAGTGLIITGDHTEDPDATNVNPRRFNVAQWGGIYNKGGTFKARGGVIMCTKTIGTLTSNANNTTGTAAAMDIKGTKFVMTAGLDAQNNQILRELRFNPQPAAATTGSLEDVIIDGYLVTHRAIPTGGLSVKLVNGAIAQLDGGPTSVSLKNLDASENIDPYADLQCDDGTTGVKTYDVTNSANGSALRMMPKILGGGGRHLGILVLKKELRFIIKDAAGNEIENAAIYMVDTDNSYRKNQNSLDSEDDKDYFESTNSQGISDMTITTAITNIDRQAANDLLDGEPWDSTKAEYPFWDTDNDGLRTNTDKYRVDRRGLDNTTDDNFLFRIHAYGYNSAEVVVSCKGLGRKVVEWTMFPDENITTADRATTAALPSISVDDTTVPKQLYTTTSYNLDQVYDYFKYLKTKAKDDAILPEVDEPYVTADGSTLVINDRYAFNVIGASNTLSPGTRFTTIKSDDSAGDAKRIQGLNSGQITATVQDSAGVSVRFINQYDEPMALVYTINNKTVSPNHENVPANGSTPIPINPGTSTVYWVAKVKGHDYAWGRFVAEDTPSFTPELTVNPNVDPNATPQGGVAHDPADVEKTFGGTTGASLAAHRSNSDSITVAPGVLDIEPGAVNWQNQPEYSKRLFDEAMSVQSSSDNPYLDWLLYMHSRTASLSRRIIIESDRIRIDRTDIDESAIDHVEDSPAPTGPFILFDKTATSGGTPSDTFTRIGISFVTLANREIFLRDQLDNPNGYIIFDSPKTVVNVQTTGGGGGTTIDAAERTRIADAVWERAFPGTTVPSSMEAVLEDLVSASNAVPSQQQIASEVWNSLLTTHDENGSFGEFVQDITSGGGGGTTIDAAERTRIAQAIWGLARSGNSASGTFGEYIDAAISTAGGLTTAQISTLNAINTKTVAIENITNKIKFVGASVGGKQLIDAQATLTGTQLADLELTARVSGLTEDQDHYLQTLYNAIITAGGALVNTPIPLSDAPDGLAVRADDEIYVVDGTALSSLTNTKFKRSLATLDKALTGITIVGNRIYGVESNHDVWRTPLDNPGVTTRVYNDPDTGASNNIYGIANYGDKLYWLKNATSLAFDVNLSPSSLLAPAVSYSSNDGTTWTFLTDTTLGRFDSEGLTADTYTLPSTPTFVGYSNNYLIASDGIIRHSPNFFAATPTITSPNSGVQLTGTLVAAAAATDSPDTMRVWGIRADGSWSSITFDVSTNPVSTNIRFNSSGGLRNFPTGTILSMGADNGTLAVLVGSNVAIYSYNLQAVGGGVPAHVQTVNTSGHTHGTPHSVSVYNNSVYVFTDTSYYRLNGSNIESVRAIPNNSALGTSVVMASDNNGSIFTIDTARTNPPILKRDDTTGEVTHTIPGRAAFNGVTDMTFWNNELYLARGTSGITGVHGLSTGNTVTVDTSSLSSLTAYAVAIADSTFNDRFLFRTTGPNTLIERSITGSVANGNLALRGGFSDSNISSRLHANNDNITSMYLDKSNKLYLLDSVDKQVYTITGISGGSATAAANTLPLGTPHSVHSIAGKDVNTNANDRVWVALTPIANSATVLSSFKLTGAQAGYQLHEFDTTAAASATNPLKFNTELPRSASNATVTADANYLYVNIAGTIHRISLRTRNFTQPAGTIDKDLSDADARILYWRGALWDYNPTDSELEVFTNLQRDLNDLETQFDPIKDATDKLNFNASNDVLATLNGELVTTDSASRAASQNTEPVPANVTQVGGSAVEHAGGRLDVKIVEVAEDAGEAHPIHADISKVKGDDVPADKLLKTSVHKIGTNAITKAELTPFSGTEADTIIANIGALVTKSGITDTSSVTTTLAADVLATQVSGTHTVADVLDWIRTDSEGLLEALFDYPILTSSDIEGTRRGETLEYLEAIQGIFRMLAMDYIIKPAEPDATPPVPRRFQIVDNAAVDPPVVRFSFDIPEDDANKRSRSWTTPTDNAETY